MKQQVPRREDDEGFWTNAGNLLQRTVSLALRMKAGRPGIEGGILRQEMMLYGKG